MLGLVGYDWSPWASTSPRPQLPIPSARRPTRGITFGKQGASLVAQCLATGKEPLFTAEHALHVVEIICAARQSQETGQRIDLTSSFKWPIVS